MLFWISLLGRALAQFITAIEIHKNLSTRRHLLKNGGYFAYANEIHIAAA